MAGFKDFVDLTILTESDLDDYLAKQAVMKFASAAARDAAVTGTFKREGMVAYQDDTNTIMVSRDATLSNWSTIGPVHGVMTTWTPVVTQGATPTLTVNYARYQRIGRWIHGSMSVTFTSAGTGGSAILVSGLPTAAFAGENPIGVGDFLDTSVTKNYPIRAGMGSTTLVQFTDCASTGVAISTTTLGSGANTFALAIASGDVLTFCFGYEAAADA